MIRLIAAIDRKRGIAKQGFQPWSIPEDEQYFTDQTKNYSGTVLIGSTTFKNFRSPLEGRKNYVLTRDTTPIEGVELVHDIDTFLKQFQDKDLWVIGGANVFGQVMEMDKADELYLTQIDADFGCNQFFPNYEHKFTIAQQSQLKEQNGFVFSFAIFKKSLVKEIT